MVDACRDRVKTWLESVECLPRRISAIEAEKREHEVAAEAARRVFDSLKCHPLAPEVMRLHYIDGMEWWKVAQAVKYSERAIMGIRAKSVSELERMLDEGE